MKQQSKCDREHFSSNVTGLCFALAGLILASAFINQLLGVV